MSTSRPGTESPKIARARLAELSQLRQLRQLREEAARRARDAQRALRDAADAAVQARKLEVERLSLARDELARTVAGEMAARMPALAPFAMARRESLDDLLERAEYALIDDEEELADAQAALDAADAAWRLARARCDAVEQLEQRTRRAFVRATEERADRELDAPSRMADATGAQ